MILSFGLVALCGYGSEPPGCNCRDERPGVASTCAWIRDMTFKCQPVRARDGPE
jgi:hypothetical protein